MVNKRKAKQKSTIVIKSQVREAGAIKTPKRKSFNWPFFSNLGLKDEKDYLIENLSMLLLSGLDILSALEAISSGIRSKKLKEIITDLKINIDVGFSLSQSLAKNKLFPEHVISLIKIGEETGKLAENLKVVVIQQQKERVIFFKVNSSQS